jgi:hypothetical protein
MIVYVYLNVLSAIVAVALELAPQASRSLAFPVFLILLAAWTTLGLHCIVKDGSM